jgi:hypothetical protein
MPSSILEGDKSGSPVSLEQRATRPVVGKAVAAASRHRVMLGSFGIAIVAVVAWRSMVRAESTSVAHSAALEVISAPERRLEITVLGVHDAVAAPAVPPEPPVAIARPVAAPASVDPPSARVAAPSRASSAARSAPARAQSSSGAKASPLPVAAVNSAPAQEPTVEVMPAQPQPKPDRPMEINPYVYK